MRRTILALVLALAALTAVAVVLLLGLRRSGLPARDGEHRLAALAAPVTVRWDRRGVPHVDAASEEDAAAALGYLHANDRLTQMELGRRAAFGRLSEIVGEKAFAADVAARTLRLEPTAEAMWQRSAPLSRRLLEAYAAGVDAWLAERGSDLPPGLRLLRVRPEPWHPRDSIAFALLMARELSFWRDRPEEARFRWLRAFGAEGVAELLGVPELHVPAEILELARDSAPPGPRMTPGGGAPGGGPAPGGRTPGGRTPGSNNWALAGNLTASGRPLLANDPHLDLHLPSVWYQVMIRAPGYEVAGMTLPGAPGVILGRGGDIAWAFTNVMADDHDLYFEELDEAGERYRRDGTWRRLEIREETIGIRGGGRRRVRLSATDRGPLLAADPAAGLPPRSLAWTAHHAADPLAALRRLSQAATVEEVLGAIDDYVCPAQNLVVALASGEILWTVVGRVPDRRAPPPPTSGAADRGLGRLPAPGWNPAYGWRGLRPRSANPTLLRPAAGRLVTANHDIRPPGYPLDLVADFLPPHRAQRIDELLDRRRDWDAAGFAALQTDVVSRYAREVVAALAGDYQGAARRAYGVLAGWDGAMELAGPAALYALVEHQLLEAIFGDEAAAHGLEAFADRAVLLRLLTGRMSDHWFDDLATPEKEDRQAILGRALAAAWHRGAARWGEEVAAWDYGWLHPLTLRHRLDGLPFFGRWSRRGPLAVAGSATTVAAFGGRWEGERQGVIYGPSMRWIVDWRDGGQTFAALPGGQSGHPADRHYDDRLAPFLAGELDPAAWSEAEITAAAVSTLRLVP